MEFRYRATVEYDGTDFQGFQIQASGRTVQGELERAIEQITQSQVRILGAGRTDAGVHASGQVIAFNVSWRHTTQDLHRALNAILPADIAIKELAKAHPAFHPRFDAERRHYRYTILNGSTRSPLWARRAHHVPEPLDLEAMQEASQMLIGHHDFAAFGRPTQGETTVRHVAQAEWREESPDDLTGKLLVFDITANAFLYRMVRNIVGTLLRVGRGELSAADIGRLLGSGDRADAGPSVPPCGLCLVSVEYRDNP